MSVWIVRLGTPRLPREGTRIGTVRRPPRGVRKERYATDDWFDVWFPDLAPSADLMARGKAAETEEEWADFARAYRAEMEQPPARRTLDLLAACPREPTFRSAATASGRSAATARCSAAC